MSPGGSRRPGLGGFQLDHGGSDGLVPLIRESVELDRRDVFEGLVQAAGVGPAQVLEDRELERADYVSYVPTDLAGIGRLDLRVARGARGARSKRVSI